MGRERNWTDAALPTYTTAPGLMSGIVTKPSFTTASLNDPVTSHHPPPDILTSVGVVAVGLQVNPNAGGVEGISLFVRFARRHKPVAVVAVVQVFIAWHQVAHHAPSHGRLEIRN